MERVVWFHAFDKTHGFILNDDLETVEFRAVEKNGVIYNFDLNGNLKAKKDGEIATVQ